MCAQGVGKNNVGYDFLVQKLKEIQQFERFFTMFFMYFLFPFKLLLKTEEKLINKGGRRRFGVEKTSRHLGLGKNVGGKQINCFLFIPVLEYYFLMKTNKSKVEI